MNFFRLALLMVPTLALGCSSGGTVARQPGSGGADACPGCPPGSSPVPGYPNPGPGPSAFGGCTGVAATGVDGKLVCQILSSFGSVQDDQAFFAEVATQRSWWSAVAPVDQVFLYRECGSGNAFATPAREIAFGTRLYHDLNSRFGPIAIEMVLAHEWSHRVQQDLGYFVPAVPTRTTELEADAFAGFYIGWSRDPGQQMLATILDTIHSIGDEDYTNPTHHGTSVERKYMALWGYAQAKAAIQAGVTPTWQGLHEAARRELSTMAVIQAFYEQ